MVLPDDFTHYTRRLLGDSLYARYMDGMSSVPPVSVRLHPRKSEGFVVDGDWMEGSVPWCEQGYYLTRRPNYTFDPLMHGGAYYVQEASSMFVSHVIKTKVTSPVVMLDLCAAPGGKSTAVLSSLPSGSLLFCNEPVPLRAQVLSENLQKYGHPDVIVTNNYPADYARSGLLFDVILADVPCSGEGMFRKDDGAVAEWSVGNVESCHRLQRDIITSAWECLRPGGLLIYSTCTLNTKENEENILWMDEHFGAMVEEVPISDDWHILGSLHPSLSLPVYRFLPGIARGEGLFMAVLRKGQDTISSSSRSSRKKRNAPSSRTTGMTQEVRHWVNNGDIFSIIDDGQEITLLPEHCRPYYDQASALKIIHAGVKAAVRKGKDLIPQPSLALSCALRRDSFAECSIDFPQAISYLRKETIQLPVGTPRGHVLITYKGLPLGFVKNLGNRSNNLYPSEWKVRSAHIPENNNEILIPS